MRDATKTVQKMKLEEMYIEKTNLNRHKKTPPKRVSLITEHLVRLVSRP